jgi:hypothetical protein
MAARAAARLIISIGRSLEERSGSRRRRSPVVVAGSVVMLRLRRARWNPVVRVQRRSIVQFENAATTSYPMRSYTGRPIGLACSVAGRSGRNIVAVQVSASP